jgi:hypothetical protein
MGRSTRGMHIVYPVTDGGEWRKSHSNGENSQNYG